MQMWWKMTESDGNAREELTMNDYVVSIVYL